MSVKDIFEAVVEMRRMEVAGLVRAEIEAGTGLTDILNQGLIAAMDEVGSRFSQGEIFVPEMLMAANAMKSGLEVIKPLLIEAGSETSGTVVIGTVKGDLHDIGKNLVAMMIEGAGFSVIDLGIDVEPGTFVTACRDHRADVVALSALLTTTLPSMKDTVEALREAGMGVAVVVGGAPVTPEFAEEIGADGFGKDAPAAVELIKGLVNRSR